MIKKITLKNSVKIVDNSYVIKKKKKDLDNTYNYLLSRSFDYFPEILREDDNYIYYRYIADTVEPDEQKIVDLVILLSLLHNKTTFYKEIDLEHYKYIYESVINQIDDTYNYYNALMDNIDSEIYMSPADYLIARNISIIYNSLVFARDIIKKWYKMIDNSRKARVVTIHNNVSLDHYIKNDKPYLISWDNSKIDLPIFDLISLYKNHYLDFEFSDILDVYLHKYPLSPDEMTLFLAIIAIPSKIKEESTEYKRVVNVRKVIDYLYKTHSLLEKYRIKQKTDKGQEFKQKN